MDMKEILKWGAIAVLAWFALRWINGAFSSVGSVNQIEPYVGYPAAQMGWVFGAPPAVSSSIGYSGWGRGKGGPRRRQGGWRAQY